MRGFVVKEHTHPSTIRVTSDVPPPTPKPGQILIDVYSAGLNFFDILQSQGKYQLKPPLPFVLGTEFAGRVAAGSPIPPGCTLKAGDRVFGAAQGTFAEQAVVDANRVLPLPDEVTYDQGAGLFITWPTSYEALVGRAQLQPGEWVLVTAAAGTWAKVIAAAGSDAKLAIAVQHGGADYTVNYSRPGWQKEVLKLTGGKGVDVVYDPVGLIQDSLKCIAWKGRALVIGFAAGNIEKVPMNLVLLKNISLVGLHWGAYTAHEPARVPVVWKELLALLASDKVKPVIYSSIYPLEHITDGLGALERRETWGKAIVRIRTEQERSKL
ncbi:hypothetical protein BD779DRAFT_1505538 [Infundibulicybe gibba]|nr:hypothetical protein BD779DRAFT_1505538 [Infundibulicybe gibba]